MGLFKENPFGHILFLKKWLIRIAGVLSHRRYRGFNEMEIEGSEIIRNLPETGVLFVSNHQTCGILNLISITLLPRKPCKVVYYLRYLPMLVPLR